MRSNEVFFFSTEWIVRSKKNKSSPQENKGRCRIYIIQCYDRELKGTNITYARICKTVDAKHNMTSRCVIMARESFPLHCCSHCWEEPQEGVLWFKIPLLSYITNMVYLLIDVPFFFIASGWSLVSGEYPPLLLRLLWRDWGNDPSPFPHNSFAAIHCQSISPIFFTKLENLCLRSFCLKLKSPQWRENLGNAKISYLIGRDRGV